MTQNVIWLVDNFPFYGELSSCVVCCGGCEISLVLSRSLYPGIITFIFIYLNTITRVSFPGNQPPISFTPNYNSLTYYPFLCMQQHCLRIMIKSTSSYVLPLVQDSRYVYPLRLQILICRFHPSHQVTYIRSYSNELHFSCYVDWSFMLHDPFLYTSSLAECMIHILISLHSPARLCHRANLVSHCPSSQSCGSDCPSHVEGKRVIWGFWLIFTGNVSGFKWIAIKKFKPEWGSWLLTN